MGLSCNMMEKSVIIGHSHLKYFDEYIKDCSTEVISHRGCLVEELILFSDVKKAILECGVIVVHCGINNVPEDGGEVLFQKFLSLFHDIQKLNSRAQVVVSQILPRSQNDKPGGKRLTFRTLMRINRTVTFVNDKLAKAAEETDGLNFVYHPGFFDENVTYILKRKMLSADGLHLSFEGTPYIVYNIERAIIFAKFLLKFSFKHVLCGGGPQDQGDTGEKQIVTENDFSETTSTINTGNHAHLEKVAMVQSNDENVKLNTKDVHSGTGNHAHLEKVAMVQSNDENVKLNTKDVHSATGNHAHLEKVAMVQSNDENVKLITKDVHSAAELIKGNANHFEAVLYKRFEENEKFDFVEALRVLISPDKSKLSTIPPHHPEGGTVYLFSDDVKGKNDDWKADGYTWRYIGKKEKIISGVTIVKVYFHLRNGSEKSSKFKRTMYRISGSNDQKLTVVVYDGDHTEYIAMPHGNSKSVNSRPFQRTLPSVLNNLKTRMNENPVDRQNAKELHNKLRSELPYELNPRNTKQIRNMQASVNRAKRLTHDSLYNLHELYYHLDGYIAEIKTLPDLHVIAAHPELISEFDRLIQMKGEDAVCLFYDTTFETGDFYISTLAFKHFMFESQPVIPLSFMIHERRKQKCHEAHFSFVKEKIPRLQKRPVPVVTDREQGIVNAFKSVFPNSHIFLCWNHILRDVEFWVKKKGASPKEIRFYKDEVKTLLQCESENEYLEMFEQRKSPWSKPFLEYFEGNLHQEIMENAGRWLLEKFNVYNPYSGITNNASESMNAKLKRLLDWKEKDIDTIVLYLYYWQNNDLNDLMSGFCDIGDLCLRNKFKDLKKDPKEIEIVSKNCHPDDVISLVKSSVENLISIHPPSVHKVEPQNKIERNDSHNESIVVKKTEDIQSEHKINTELSNETTAANLEPEHIKIVQGRSIALVPEMAAFLVKGLSGTKYAVTLFPKESCQCPSTRRCCHIQAARVSIGLDAEENKKKVVNLTQLLKNARPRKFKKSGRKRPRDEDLADDITIIPAPDSILAKSLNESEIGAFSDGDLVHSTPKRAKIATPKTPKSILKSKPKTKPDSKKKLRFSSKLKELNKKLAEECSQVKSDITSDQWQESNLNCSMEHIHTDCSFEEIRQDGNFDNAYWIKELSLKDRERRELTQNKKLTSYHMEAVNILARKQFSNIDGFQLTEKIPNYIKTEKRWNIDSVMNEVLAPACQIHHTNSDHWVVSFQDNENKIFVFDSLGNERNDNNILTDSLKLQLASVYGGSQQSLLITVPDTHRQSNGVDCGLYAIAHLVEFCVHGRPMPNVIFDTAQMRSHLIKCLETQHLSEFPKTNKLLNTRKKRDAKTFNIPLYCICALPSCLDNMIPCGKCKSLFHRNCVLSPSWASNDDFICVSCA